jgi:predicted outer membrane repeat protein
LSNSTVSDNITFGSLAHGGGIAGDNVTLTHSTVSGNSTYGGGAEGGGIYASGNVMLTDSTVSENATYGGGAGGGIMGDTVTLTNSTVSGNFTWIAGFGGGINAEDEVIAINSIVSGNSTYAIGARAGGISSPIVTLTNSTVSGNSARGHGGGISAGTVALINCTVTGNSTSDDRDGGGIFAHNVTLRNTIVAKNTASRSGADIFLTITSSIPPPTITATHSLVGSNDGNGLSPTQTPDANGNLIGTRTNPIDPRLGQLADNGGPTKTHALLPGSPAIDAGALVDATQHDQRGTPYLRVYGPAPDMGAFELQPVLPGDANQDGSVDLLDFQALKANLGTTSGATLADGDFDGDADVDLGDFNVLKSNFGAT